MHLSWRQKLNAGTKFIRDRAQVGQHTEKQIVKTEVWQIHTSRKKGCGCPSYCSSSKQLPLRVRHRCLKSEPVRPRPFQSPPQTSRILSMSTGWLLFAFYEIDLTARTPWAPRFSIGVVRGWYCSHRAHLFTHWHTPPASNGLRGSALPPEMSKPSPHTPAPRCSAFISATAPQEYLGVCVTVTDPVDGVWSPRLLFCFFQSLHNLSSLCINMLF